MSCLVLWGGWGTVLQGKVLYGMVWRCPAWYRGVQRGTVLQGIMRFGREEWCKARFSTVGCCCGVVWSGDVLHRMVESCPVKHGMPRLGIWFGAVMFRGVLSSAAMYAKALLRHGIVIRGTVESCLARLGTVR